MYIDERWCEDSICGLLAWDWFQWDGDHVQGHFHKKNRQLLFHPTTYVDG